MLDVSRNKVPKLETLFDLIDRFAQWKINELQLYIEHTFAYPGHEIVWENASPLTADDIQELDTYCEERFIELVPNLNCFGHMSKWLVHDPYNQLAEQPEGGETDFGYRKEPQGLCPIDSGSIALANDLIQKMTSCFKSKQVNVGCDETIDLGYGRSKASVKKKGRGKVYLEYLKKVHSLCRKEGRTMQFWADILLKYPELLSEAPKGSIALIWGYEANHPFEEETKRLGSSEIAFYVCPGTSSWNSMGGRTNNLLENVRKAAKYGKAHGALGFMTTDWGDNGHLQPLLSSFPGFVLGAALSWNESSDLQLESALDLFVFNQPGWGELILKIGRLDEPFGIYIHNQTILFQLLWGKSDFIHNCAGLTIDKLEATLEMAHKLQSQFSDLRAKHPIDLILEKEFDWVIKILIHACHRGLAILLKNNEAELRANAKRLRDQHEMIWSMRNRPGGYELSRALFEVLTSG
jgi:hypothetical protein